MRSVYGVCVLLSSLSPGFLKQQVGRERERGARHTVRLIWMNDKLAPIVGLAWTGQQQQEEERYGFDHCY